MPFLFKQNPHDNSFTKHLYTDRQQDHLSPICKAPLKSNAMFPLRRSGKSGKIQVAQPHISVTVAEI